MADLQKLQFNNRTILVPSRDSFVGFKEQDPIYNVITSGSNGTVTASPTSGRTGSTVTLSNTPDSGYKFSSYTVTGTGASLSGNTLTIGTSDVTVVGNFTALQTATLNFKITMDTWSSSSIWAYSTNVWTPLSRSGGSGDYSAAITLQTKNAYRKGATQSRSNCIVFTGPFSSCTVHMNKLTVRNENAYSNVKWGLGICHQSTLASCWSNSTILKQGTISKSSSGYSSVTISAFDVTVPVGETGILWFGFQGNNNNYPRIYMNDSSNTGYVTVVS